MSENKDVGNWRYINTYVINITKENALPFIQKYYASYLKKLTKDYESVLKDIVNATEKLLTVINDWVYSTKPTPVLLENYEQLRQYIEDSIGTAIKLREQIKQIIATYFPGTVVFTKPVPHIEVPPSSQLPERVKLKEKIADLSNRIRDLVLVLKEKLQDIAMLKQELAEAKKQILAKYKARLLEKLRQYKVALEKGDKDLADQRMAEIMALRESMKREYLQTVHSYIRKHRDTIDDAIMIIGKLYDTINEYLDIVQPNDQKVYKGVLEQLYRAKETLQKIEVLGNE